VRDVLLDLLLLIIGIPSSYLLTRRRLERQDQSEFEKTGSRIVAVKFSLGLWLDGLMFAIFVEIFPNHWWETFIVWFVINYAAFAIFIIKRNHSRAT
jgi:hypothetical protein